jgi:riboflavin kinase/FMN adenylyltransferase
VIRIDNIADLASSGRPLHLALGVFDGVHVGHQAVIRAAVAAAGTGDGLAGVVTFEPHPIRVLAPAKAPRRLLASLDHKAAILADAGVGLLCVLHFDAALAQLEAAEFLAGLPAGAGQLQTIAVGEDWRFGRGRRGDVAALRAWGEGLGVRVIAVPPVIMDGERVSSTRIRQALRDGNLTAAAKMLGRPYAVVGTVLKGRKLGRTLGFPTANLAVGDEQLPPDGVWVVAVNTGKQQVRGVANLGRRPTVDGGERTLEVHLLDFAGDLYGQTIEVRFERFLREERRFASLEQLTQQIADDVEQARSWDRVGE